MVERVVTCLGEPDLTWNAISAVTPQGAGSVASRGIEPGFWQIRLIAVKVPDGLLIFAMLNENVSFTNNILIVFVNDVVKVSREHLGLVTI